MYEGVCLFAVVRVQLESTPSACTKKAVETRYRSEKYFPTLLDETVPVVPWCRPYTGPLLLLLVVGTDAMDVSFSKASMFYRIHIRGY